MAKKSVMREGQAVSSSSRWWNVIGRTLAVGFIIVGALLLFRSHVSTSTASTGSPKTTTSTNLSQRSLPLIPESQWGKWYKGNVGQSFPTTKSPFMQGQMIIVPNYVSIRVDSIARNWTPQPWQASPPGSGGQDNAAGKEVILVRFTIKNLSNVSLTYSDGYFSLVRANGHEQRVAELNDLTGDQYGCFGQTSPWLHPGATVHTFVPFLVNPGEKPGQFVLTWRTVDPTKTTQNGTETLPVYQNIARIPINLSALATPGASVTFVHNATFTVTTAEVYSTSVFVN